MKTVLLVEDDDAFSYAASKAIEDAGYRVIVSRDTMEGLRAIDVEQTIDFVIADIKMPPGRPHGFAFGSMVHRRLPDVPILYLTAYPELAAHALGSDRVLYKPLDEAALVDAINAQLRS